MAPHRVAGAATVSPYVYDGRQERATSGQALVQSSSVASGVAGAVTSAAATNANENADRGAPHGKGKKSKAKPRAERPPRQEEEMRFNTGPRNLRPPQANRGGRRGFRIPGRTYPEDQNGIPDYPPPSFQEAMTTPPVSVCSSTTSLPLAPPLPLIIPENIPEEPRVSINQRVEESRVSIDQPVAQAVTNEVQRTDDDVDFEGEMFIVDRNSVPVCSTDLPRGAALEERVKSDWLKRRGTEFPNKSSVLTNHLSASKPLLNDGINALARGRSAKKLLTPLLIDPDPKNDGFGPVPISPKKRFLSLSPLKTIFPPRSPVHADRATLSAHPSPTSPYHTSRSLFFRSSSSLATASFLRLPLLSSPHTGKREPLSRRIFRRDRSKQHPDGLQHNAEAIENWEVIDEETCAEVDESGNEIVFHPRSLLSAVESIQPHSSGDPSPTKSVSFSLATPYMSDVARGRRPLVVPEPLEDERRALRTPLPQASQETFLRDWKGSSQLFLDRSVHRNRSPTPGAAESMHRSPTSLASESTTSLNLGPPLVTVRVRSVSPSPSSSVTMSKHAAQVAHPSPLRAGTNTRHVVVEDQSAAEAAMYQRALDTPLPMTPTLYSQFDHEGSVAAFNDADSFSDPPVLSAGLPRLLTKPISAHDDHHRIAPGLITAPATLTSRIATPPLPSGPSAMSVPTEVVKTNSLEEPITPTRHHYAGRPLPRPPPSASVPAPTNTNRVHVVDSIYASTETPLILRDNPLNTCPEGLLIDLEDTTLDTIPASRSSTPLSSERYTSQPHLPLAQVQAQTHASSSSVDLIADPRRLNISSSRSPLSGSRHSPSAAVQQNNTANNVLSDLTDLDLLVSRLADADPNGADYDTLLLLSEVIGPASTDMTSTTISNPNPNLSSNQSSSPNHIGRPADSHTTPTTTSSSNMTSSSPNRTPQHPNDNISLIARIEVKRRRVTDKGVVKLKLSLLDVAVNKCGICLFQFKDGEMGALTSVCQHSFHENCLSRWLRRSKTCPLCRVPLDTDIR